jgi:ABC-type multidrug transport system fused ATPase/permease subunit
MAPIVRLARGSFAVIVVLSLATGLLEAAVLVLVAHAASQMGTGGARTLTTGPLHLGSPTVGAELGLAALILAARLASASAVAWLTARMAAASQHRLRTDVVMAFEEASWDVQSTEREGGLSHLAAAEVERASYSALNAAGLTSAVCNLTMLVLVAIWVSPIGAVATLAAVTLLYFTLRPVSRRVRLSAAARSRGEGDLTQTINEVVRTAEEVRVFGVGPAVASRLEDESAAVARSASRVYLLGRMMPTVYQCVALGLIIVALAVVNAADIARPAALASMVLMLLRAFTYSQTAQTAHHGLHENAPSLHRVRDETARYRRHRVRSGDRALAAIAGLRLDEVVYEYPGGRRALDGVSLDVAPGSTVGVIGPSGAGKSTLIQILLRLRDPSGGAYLVNGRPAAGYAPDDWARAVSYIPQDPKLVAGSVADNIRFLRPGLSDEAVVAAARDAGLHDEIVEWPLGYATTVGVRGLSLSGGQRQRLCLARALAAGPALLVLDEPTSALDMRSEALVQESLQALGGRTTIVIVAHRVSTLSICDWLLVLNHGRVESSGRPADLAAGGGFYRDALDLAGLS